ncbi:lipoprotein NlpI [Kingella potus]|uniref:Lipoprotein NlpI n=1 Tax=Kingella potus TaxID=265175 RepID=A0A377R3I7_9NEIS|nr:type IV pilus biogenesis/stability protein PilW [Kingella potus]UOP00126.1 type IV pilus biogenesis/stability protein PilW [Kingella potus]STR02819.1 lipoprotein NlpI [Kingella potus]
MKHFLKAALLVCILGACGGTSIKQPSRQERTEEISRIKTQLAGEYMGAKDYRLAVTTIEEALQADRKNATAWLMRAQIYQFLKVNDKAVASFHEALRLQPDSAEINNNYGWFLCSAMNNPNAAIPHFDKALSDPTYPSPQVAYMNKGICSAKMGQYSLAQAYLERGIAAAPDFMPLRKELARTKMLAGQIKEADKLFRQYQSQVDALDAGDLLLGWQLARATGRSQAAYEYEAQLRANYPYSEELQTILAGH